MNRILKIIGTILIIATVVLKFTLSVAIASSSHTIPIINKENSIDTTKIALAVGLLLILMIWFPWKSMFELKKQSNK